MKHYRIVAIGLATALALCASAASASELVYKPTDPAFGGDPNNGSWLLSQANAQSADSGGSGSGFSIDFPDFGGVTQPTTPDDTNLPPVPTDNTNTNNSGN